MAPKEPTRHQLSSRLTYSQHTPAFLLRFKNRISGGPEDDEVDDGEPDAEWDGTGRPPIPRRPSIPQRPDDDPGSADEDSGDEKPMVVVLKEGRHLTKREVENIKRRERGLPPLPEPSEPAEQAADQTAAPVAGSASASKPKTESTSLSFSSSKSGPTSARKRKAIGSPAESRSAKEAKPLKKKFKKESKGLLSFDGDA